MNTLVGKPAPDFSCSVVLADGTIQDNFQLSKQIKGKPALVFFYPLDFTFVCPSELIALHNRMNKFKERGIQVITVSVDSAFAHHAWRDTPIDNGGIGQVDFIMAADISHDISKSYGVYSESGISYRGAFIIDKNGVVRSVIANDFPIGRDIDEILRLFDAVQFNEENGEVCPAGWRKGEAGMKPSTEGVAKFLATHSEKL